MSAKRTVRAAVLVAQNQPLALLDLEVPELRAGQVLVDIAYSGLCHTQLNEWKGAKGPDPFLPHTLGHEGSGTVAEVGPEVTKVKVGDRVVLSWIKGEGAEVPSARYDSPIGPVNSGAISTFMRRTVVSENRLVVISDDMPLREAALLGCAVPTGAGIVTNTAKLSPGDKVVVFGAGGVGLSAVLGAKANGAGMVIVVDVNPSKLEAARDLGADHLVDASAGDPVQAVLDLTGGKGADLAIEAAGRAETMEAAYRSIRTGGGLCVLAGNLPKGQTISIDPIGLIAGKRLVGTWGGETRTDRDIPTYVEQYKAGRLPLARLITRDYDLEDINDAFRDLSEGKVIRALIRM